MPRTAVFVFPAFVLAVAGGVALGTFAGRMHPSDGGHRCQASPSTPATPAAAVAPKPAPAPGRYDHPVGGQYLDSFGRRFAANAGPPTEFLLDSREMATHRYNQTMPRLANAMLAELADALHDASAPIPTVDSLVEMEREFGLPQLRRWHTEEDIGVDHRSITIRTRDNSMEVACELASSTVGMGMYNDLATCTLAIRDRAAHVVLRYEPTVRHTDDREGIALPTDAFEQRVTFPNGEAIVIRSGTAADAPGVSHVPAGA